MIEEHRVIIRILFKIYWESSYCTLLFVHSGIASTSITPFFIMLSETWLADPYVCGRRASNSARVKVDQTRWQGLGNCIAFISWYRYCWESGRTSRYRVSSRSPNWSAPTSARRISNANATRVALLENLAARLSSRRNHTRFLSPSNSTLVPLFALFALLPPVSTFYRFSRSFLPFLLDAFTLGKESRDIPDIFAFPDSTAGSILPENSSPWSFVANIGEIEERE